MAYKLHDINNDKKLLSLCIDINNDMHIYKRCNTIFYNDDYNRIYKKIMMYLYNNFSSHIIFTKNKLSKTEIISYKNKLYKCNRKIGSGAFGKVFLCDKTQNIIKMIQNGKILKEYVIVKIDSQTQLTYPMKMENIELLIKNYLIQFLQKYKTIIKLQKQGKLDCLVTIHNIFYYEDRYTLQDIKKNEFNIEKDNIIPKCIILMEHIKGITLYDYLLNNKSFIQQKNISMITQIKTIFKTIISYIQILRKHKIYLLDLNLKNILIQKNNQNQFNIRIIDLDDLYFIDSIPEIQFQIARNIFHKQIIDKTLCTYSTFESHLEDISKQFSFNLYTHIWLNLKKCNNKNNT